MIVMKFGGTSVGSAEAITRLIEIVRTKVDRVPIVVVSAFSGITDGLYQVCSSLEIGDMEAVQGYVEEIRGRHVRVLGEILDIYPEAENHFAEEYVAALEFINDNLEELMDLAHLVHGLGELSDRSRVRIISVGEILSSYLIWVALNHSSLHTTLVNARDMIITDEHSMKGAPLMDCIAEKVPERILPALEKSEVVITQGFLASTSSGHASVLGRGGSDYTASLIGCALGAEEIEIWTDVDGIFSADPHRVPGAKSLRLMSFEEAAEMAQFGAKVLHPSTILPAVEKNIPVRVLNSKNPDHEGTIILQGDSVPAGIKSISFKERITVMNIFSTNMIDAFGFLEKVFEVFGRHKVSVDLISTSEANVSLTIDEDQPVERIVEELSGFSEVKIEKDKSQVSVIGKGLMGVKGLFSKVFSILEEDRIYMVSQGASAINLSFVIERDSLWNIVNRLHYNLFENE